MVLNSAQSFLISAVDALSVMAFIAHVVGGGATPSKKEIQKIDPPENWDSPVAKYKNVVPAYAKC